MKMIHGMLAAASMMALCSMSIEGVDPDDAAGGANDPSAGGESEPVGGIDMTEVTEAAAESDEDDNDQDDDADGTAANESEEG